MRRKTEGRNETRSKRRTREEEKERKERKINVFLPMGRRGKGVKRG